MSDKGQLSCSYLGTDPSLFVASAPENREFSFKESEEELKALDKAIKSSAERKFLMLNLRPHVKVV